MHSSDPKTRRFKILPEGASSDAVILLQARGLRGLADGIVSVILAVYLTRIGLSTTQVGLVVAATLLGSATLTMLVGIWAHAYSRRLLLRLMAILMVATGVGFAVLENFWLLIVVALVGTMNPSGGDVSAFIPTEQAVLPATISNDRRTALFARYSLLGALLAAVGAALAGAPEWIADHASIGTTTALRLTFLVYALIGVVIFSRYNHLSDSIEQPVGSQNRSLGDSKRTVYRLAALFSLDSFGSGFTITAILVLWLKQRFGLSLAVSGAVFFWAGLLASGSQLAAVWLAGRIGLIRTMAYTHLPASGFLILAAFMPNAPLAVACLLGRAAFSQMDIPARTSYVMAVVTPEERPAAASITNVPRSLAGVLPPIAAGWMLSVSDYGWPLILGGTIKIAYDLLLLVQFRNLVPPEEMSAPVAET